MACTLVMVIFCQQILKINNCYKTTRVLRGDCYMNHLRFAVQGVGFLKEASKELRRNF